MPRRYELKERAKRRQDTRRRIVEATMALHEEVGPARTTVADVARRAGVGRVTVYNHFPDAAALIGACSAHAVAAHPPPDPAAWAGVTDPAARLEAGLRATYAYYRANAAMLGHVTRDASTVPALAAALAEGGASEYDAAVKDVLTGPYARAAVGLALSFATWERLTAVEDLTDAEAVALMIRAVTGTLAE